MNTQPEALRLADALDDEYVQGRISNSTGRESAVELRRLHEALETEREECAKVCEILGAEDDSFYAEFSRAKDCAAAIRARSEK